jgi:hypothetical protein
VFSENSVNKQEACSPLAPEGSSPLRRSSWES